MDSNEMVPDLPDCSLKIEDETQTDFTEQEAYLREIIDNNNEKIHKLEQEIEELKQVTQRQRDAFNKRLFNFENCKSKDSNAAFYTEFFKFKFKLTPKANNPRLWTLICHNGIFVIK